MLQPFLLLTAVSTCRQRRESLVTLHWKSARSKSFAGSAEISDHSNVGDANEIHTVESFSFCML